MIRIIVHEEADDFEEMFVDADFTPTMDSTATDVVTMLVKAMKIETYAEPSIIKALEEVANQLKEDITFNYETLTKEDEE